MVIRPFEPPDEAAVIELWRRCELTRPWNDPRRDILRKRSMQPHMFLVGIIDGGVAGTVMAGYDGHRGWMNYLAVSPEHRGRGHGRALMAEAERLLRLAGCPKVNLQIRSGNVDAIEFYRRIGFAIDDVVSMGKRLEHDEPAGD